MPTRRVLVIDDEADIRTIVQACLEDIACWEVLTAQSGQEGIQIATTASPDGILLDVSMPGMGGLETLKILQTDTKTRQIPIVLLTAKTMPAEQDYFLSLGIVGLILKPFDPMTLVDQVATIFNWKL